MLGITPSSGNKFPQDLPPENKIYPPKITRLTKLLLPPAYKSMATIILLQVAILCSYSNFALAATLHHLPTKESHVVPTTEFTPTQFHIQTDDGKNRFFKYQTWSGQFRKETRNDDGSVAGSYGWVDANGMMRVYEYVADKAGYRITKSGMYNVGKQTESQSTPKLGSNVPNSIDQNFKRNKSNFLRPLAPFKNRTPNQPRKEESELSNDILEADNEVFIIPITSPKPIIVSLKRRPKNRPQKSRRRPLLPFIKRNRKGSIKALKTTKSNLDLVREQNGLADGIASNRLQRRISTIDGQTKMINVQPLFYDDETESEEDNEVSEEVAASHYNIDNGDDILHLPSLKEPNGRLILNTPQRRTVNFLSSNKNAQMDGKDVARLRFTRRRNRQQRRFQQRPSSSSVGGPFVIKRRRRPAIKVGKIPTTRKRTPFIDNADSNGVTSINYLTSKTFHHESTSEDGQRNGQYGYIDPIGVRRVVTYTTGPRKTFKQKEPAIRKIKENDFYGRDTYFKAT